MESYLRFLSEQAENNRKNLTYSEQRVHRFLINYDEKSPSFREGMNHHPYYFLQKYYFFSLKTKYFRKKYNFF